MLKLLQIAILTNGLELLWHFLFRVLLIQHKMWTKLIKLFLIIKLPKSTGKFQFNSMKSFIIQNFKKWNLHGEVCSFLLIVLTSKKISKSIFLIFLKKILLKTLKMHRKLFNPDYTNMFTPMNMILPEVNHTQQWYLIMNLIQDHLMWHFFRKFQKLHQVAIAHF